MISSDVCSLWQKCDQREQTRGLFGRGSDSQLWDWLTIHSANRMRESYKQSFWLGPQVERWLAVGSPDSDICIKKGFISFSINGTVTVDPSPLDRRQNLPPICYRDTAAVHWAGPTLRWVHEVFSVRSRLNRQSSFTIKVSLTRSIIILKNSAILFSNYINNSKFVLLNLLSVCIHVCELPIQANMYVAKCESWHPNILMMFRFLKLEQHVKTEIYQV